MNNFDGPQPFNVDLSASEMADETGARSFPPPPKLYDPPPVEHIQPDPDLYPPVRHGVRGPRLRR